MNFKKEIDGITKLAMLELDKLKVYQRTNEDRLKAIGNIYFIYSNGEMKYIGQRQAKGIKTRLDQHLFGKSFSVDKNNVQNGTISKWNKVSAEIENGNKITFKTILIKPDNLRTTIELELINHFKPEWNIQGK
tara:strand:+ start:186 stop:584 length:399 start_codon:yes stop_codon:yes gene_type:complete